MKGYGTVKETTRGHKVDVRIGDLEHSFTVDGGYMFALECAGDWFEANGADDWEVEDITYG